MKFRMVYLLASFLLLPAAGAEEDGSFSLASLEELVRVWTDLRQEIAAEQREWSEQKHYLESEISLLEKEIARSKSEIEEFKQFSNAQEQKVKEQSQRKIELLGYFEGLKPLLDTTEAFVRSRRERLPASLQHRVIVEEKSRGVDRIQVLAAALVQLEELQNDIHVTREIMLDDQGDRREMEVLYFGLAQGFAVSAQNDWAGWGKPSPEEWQWESRPELAPEIRRLLDIYAQKQPAGFIRLPFQLSEFLPEDRP